MARSVFKREKLLADLRAMQDPYLQPIIDQIEAKQLGCTQPKPKHQAEQLVINFRFGSHAPVAQ